MTFVLLSLIVMFTTTLCTEMQYYLGTAKNTSWMFDYLGKPTSLAPMPNPAPWRAVAPMLGAKKSSRENVHAAVRAIIMISIQLLRFLSEKK